jgi:phosphate uptake regulator
MVHNVLDAFAARDPDKAVLVCERDRAWTISTIRFSGLSSPT